MTGDKARSGGIRYDKGIFRQPIKETSHYAQDRAGAIETQIRHLLRVTADEWWCADTIPALPGVTQPKGRATTPHCCPRVAIWALASWSPRRDSSLPGSTAQTHEVERVHCGRLGPHIRVGTLGPSAP